MADDLKVSNVLSVSGTKDELAEFKSANQGICALYEGDEPCDEIHCLTFNGTVPVPETVVKYDREGFEWQIDNWGTRSDAFNRKVEEKDGKLIYTFTSDDDPPLPWLEMTACHFPDLTLELTWKSDEGEGKVVCKGGAIVNE